MKPKNYTAKPFHACRCLSTLTLVFTVVTSSLHAQSWNVVGNAPTAPNTVGFSIYNWDDTANWTPASSPNAVDASAQFDINILFNGPGGPQLQGTQQVNLNVPTIVGNLTLGDSSSASAGFNGNGFYNIANGTAGSLNFESTGFAATLQKTVGSGTLDTISASITLTSPLIADVRTGTIEIGTTTAGPAGLISGDQGITRAAGVTAPEIPTTAGGTLILTNSANTYTGDTIIEHGTLAARLSGDILESTPSNFGNSANPIVVGTADTLASGSGSSTLNFIATDDVSNYAVSRGLDLSAFTTGQTARQVVNFNGNLYNFNPAGGLNTNTLTLSGPIFIGGRNIQFQVLRSGMTVNITSDITGTNPAGSDGFRFNNFPSAANVDGRGAGTFRLSNLERSYSAAMGVLAGTLIIDGVVGPLDTDSPIGQKAVSLSIGSGGNILGAANFSGSAAAALDTSPDTTRALFLDSAGSSYARAIAIGNGSSVTAAGVTGATTGSTAIPSLYGLNDGAAATDASRVNVINGFKIGGLNTSGTTTFTGNINSGTLQVGNENANNTIDVGVNLALMSGTGGTTRFEGNINDTSNGAFRPSVTRVAINQFRNHPNLDGNNGTNIGADGIPDAAANALIGTATGGTVILSGANTYEGGTEVLGGTLLVDNASGSGTGIGEVIVTAGAKLGGSGTIDGTVTLAAGAGLAFVINTDIGNHDPLDIGDSLALPDDVNVTILDGTDAEPGTYTLLNANGDLTAAGPLPVPTMPSGLSGTLEIVGSSLQITIAVATGSDYDTWIASFSPPITGADLEASADPDKDGLTNLQEYAFGLIPNDGTSVNPIVEQLDKATGKFTYTRRIPTLADPDLSFSILTSTTLSGWTVDPIGTANQNVINTVGDVQTVEVTLDPLLLANPALFVRVAAD